MKYVTIAYRLIAAWGALTLACAVISALFWWLWPVPGFVLVAAFAIQEWADYRAGLRSLEQFTEEVRRGNYTQP